ncbi:MAG: polyprenyl P-hydroxybenzoate and phenylacrylic acid decarboxylase [Oscillospiraceae bacterium]|nr:polyprenyl P-hydroxybenzoate and phenylacrylic acid decarboxylase [Oscillospiraceae bacterium]
MSAIKKRIMVGVSGASGAPLAVACLKELKQFHDWEAHLILGEGAAETIEHETEYTVDQFTKLADHVYPLHQLGASPASGSFETAGMVIVPCSMKTLAGIHSGYGDNLLLRAADVTIKEQRKLVLVARETPLSPIHLRNMSELSMIPGVTIMPPVLTFYQQPKSIDDVIHHLVAKILGRFGLEVGGFKRWEQP